jgi:hypothetical protein
MELFCQDGDIRREYTAKEYAQAKLDVTDSELAADLATAQLATRTVALAKLAALGLTADDLKALGL